MKKIFQDLKTGKTSIEEVPMPNEQPNKLLIRSKVSLISPGTEKMLLEFGKANLVSKALKQPEKAKKILNKIKSDGLIETINTVKDKLSSPIPLGYSSVGEVIHSNDDKFKVGDRVLSNGAHAEIVSVSPNLCAKIPDNVDNDAASFGVLGAVGLQGIRLINPTIGESIVVFGLGIIGMLSLQILKANGCRAIGIDNDQDRCKLAEKLGFLTVLSSKSDDIVEDIKCLNNNSEVDAVLITASSDDNKIINQSANMCRQKGRIVLVGVTGLKIERDNFYKKEISFSVSSSYGPGRYDRQYEEHNIDLPIGLVRWSAKRNFETVLNLIKENKIVTDILVTSKISMDEAGKAYEELSTKPTLGIIISYEDKITNRKQTIDNLNYNRTAYKNVKGKFALVGAGNYTKKFILPALKNNRLDIKYIASLNGENAHFLSKKYLIEKNTTDIDSVMNDNEIENIIISTTHDSHADLVCKALEKNKNIFVEKPLCISISQLKTIEEYYRRSSSILMVGYNRRFSPLSIRVKELISLCHEPISVNYTINAGRVPKESWVGDKDKSGGRIIGEVCHFIDLIKYFCGSSIREYHIVKKEFSDSCIINLIFKNNSIANINYFDNGSKIYQKERIEIFVTERTLIIENFRKLKGFGWNNFNTMNLWKQNKGNMECVNGFIKSIKNSKDSPISFEDIFEISDVTLKLSG